MWNVDEIQEYIHCHTTYILELGEAKHWWFYFGNAYEFQWNSLSELVNKKLL